MNSQWRTLLIAFASLLLLLALTVALYFVPMGTGNLIANLSIAAAKATVIALYFMHLRKQENLVRIAAVTGLVWLTLLFWLTLNDYLTRPVS